MGRDPAAVGVGDHRARRARPRARRSDARQGRRGLAGLHGRGRRAAAARGVPVAGLGHRARAARAARLRRSRRPPALVSAGEYLLREEVTRQGRLGDPQRRTSLPAAGRSSTRTTTTPTSTTRPSSRSRCTSSGIGEDAIARGVDWLVGMQSRDGGWGAFDVDNSAMWLYKIPFCDFGKVTDEPSADVTAHSLETLGDARRPPRRGGARARVAPLRAGGGRLLVRPLGREPPLRHGRRAARASRPAASRPTTRRCAAPSPGSTPSSRRAAASARTSAPTPIPRGAAGRSSRRRRRRRGRCSRTWPQETLKIRAAGRAADYLCAAQRPDGDWDEEHFTGTGFPLDFMIRYHLYRITFPLLALGRLRERLAG